MATTFKKIATVTVGAGGASSIDFTDIPQTFTDLVLKVSARSTTSSGATWNYIEVRPNGATTNSTYRQIFGNGSSVGTGTNSFALAAYGTDSSATSSTFGNSETYICNYTGSTTKSMLSDAVTENNATSALTQISTSIWNQTTAITSLSLVFGTGNFAQYSTATLYGVESLSLIAKATGGSITTDGTHVIHTFTSSGTFTPSQSLTVDYLVVAGGGSGASGTTVNRRGGAGGAGGYRTSVGAGQGSPLSLTAQAYTVTVGAGATASGSVRTPGTKGSDSVFSTITSTGGGFGSTPDGAPGSGGSGGGAGDGASSFPDPTGTGGAGNTPSTSPSQGNNGGNTGPGGNGTGGGTGGGATAAGIASTDSAGGAGASNSISGSSVTYSTGGAVISGGGGISASANTGDGGSGGAPNGGLAGNGGSGIVIVRYPI